MGASIEIRATQEGTKVVTLTFTNENKVLMTPDTVSWSWMTPERAIINARSAVSVTPAESVDIVLSGADLALLSDKDSGQRLFYVYGTYSSTYGMGLHYKAEQEVQVGRLRSLP